MTDSPHRWILLVAFLGLALAAPTAHAAAPSGRLDLRLGGAALVWPFAADPQAVAPGSTVQVRVRRTRQAAPARLALIRLDGGRRTVASRTLRRGTFTARVASQPGASYLLRVVVGRRRHQTRLGVLPPPVRSCPRTGTVSSELTLGATSGRAGDAIPATVVNRGSACLHSGFKLQWEARQPDGSFAAVAAPGPITLELYEVAVGESRAFQGRVWSNLQPGLYRAVLVSSGPDERRTTATAPFEVVP